MPRLSRARVSDEDSAAKCLAEADAETRQRMTASLAGTFHFKKLARPTTVAHNRTKKLWELFVSQHKDKDTLPPEIIPGAQLPDHSVGKEFVRWLGYTLQGRLDKFCVKSSIENHMNRFFALWRQYAFTPIPAAYRQHVTSYFNSAEYDETSKLSTKARVKQTANIVDIQVLIRGLLADKKYCRTNRERYDAIYNCLITALSSERPGAIVESGCYRGSNEALTWDTHDYWIIPDPDHPRRPHPTLILSPELLKGHRDEEAIKKHFFILQEPDNHRHVDALMYSFVNALTDDIFEDVNTIEEIFFPEHPCTRAHKLRIKKSALKQPVFRKTVWNGTKWITSDTLAMPYNMAAALLRQISIFLGFILWFTFYCFRRCSANNMNAALPEDERVRMMGQKPGSNQFFESYQARLSVIDLGAILAGRLDANEDNVAIMKVICGMSKDRDPNAPISLDVEDVNELMADPELVEFRETKAKLVATLKREITNQARCETDEEKEMQHTVIRKIRTGIRDVDRKHGAIVHRETYHLLAAKRKKYFEEASMRQLRGIGPTVRVPLAATHNIPMGPPRPPVNAPGKENRVPNAPDANARPVRVRRSAVSDPMEDALAIIDNFTLETAGAQHFVDSVNALLGLPERPSKPCYPGESPTKEGLCPVCLIETTTANMNKGGGSVATHIHKCIMGQLCKTVQQDAEDDYSPVACSWMTCSDETVWDSRAAFCIHLTRHLENLRSAAHRSGVASCKWETVDASGTLVPCGETNCDDLEGHFARVHGINSSEKIDVQYCAICAESFIDFDGDGEVWNEHCMEHYADLFHPFATRIEAEVDFSQHGVIFTPAIDHCIQFENGSGFDGQRAEFHGHLDHQVPLAPFFCPLCIFNETLSMPVRMTQFCRNQDFQLHLSRHKNGILLDADNTDDEARQCPVPACGTHSFAAHDLIAHLVVFHRVPICGSTNHTSFRRLRLPKVEETQPLIPMDVDVVDLAHLHDDDEQPMASGSGTSAAAPVAGPSKKRKYTAANPYVKVELNHRCQLHRKQYRDIRDHIPAHCNETTFRIRDPNLGRSKRGVFGPVHNFAEWCASDEAGEYVPSEDAGEVELDSDEERPAKKPRVEKPICGFKCAGCSKEFLSITKHLKSIRKDTSKCKKDRFKVRLPDGTFGKIMTLAEWQTRTAAPATPIPFTSSTTVDANIDPSLR